MVELQDNIFGWVPYYGHFSFWESNFNLYHFGHPILICVHWEGTKRISGRIWWHIQQICYINTSLPCHLHMRTCHIIKESHDDTLIDQFVGKCCVNKSGYVVYFGHKSRPRILMTWQIDVDMVNVTYMTSNSLWNSLGTLVMNTNQNWMAKMIQIEVRCSK